MKIKIKENFIKLDTLLKLAGIASTGGQAKIMILSDMVLLNGEICTQRGKKIYEGDKVVVQGEIIEVETA